MISSDRAVLGSPFGVVLAGGGARGAYEVGVLEALFRGQWQHGRGQAIDDPVLVGASVGAFNAAMLASRPRRSGLEDVRYLRALWAERIAQTDDGTPAGVFSLRGRNQKVPGRWTVPFLGQSPREIGQDLRQIAAIWALRMVGFTFVDEPWERKLARLFDLSDLITDRPLLELIEECLAPEHLLSSRALPLSILTTQWDRGKSVIFSNRKIADVHRSIWKPQRRPLTPQNARKVILASAALPGLIPPVRIGTDLFADGSALAYAPLHLMLGAAVEQIHMIHLEPELGQIPFGRPHSMFESMERLMLAFPGSLMGAELHHAELTSRLIRAAEDISAQAEVSDSNGSGAAPRFNEETRELLRQFLALRKFVVHRHFPSRHLGGAFGLLDFGQKPILRSIELGFHDAVHHDCEKNGCIV